MKRSLPAVFTAAAAVIGTWHLWLATRAIFVFPSSEPIASWFVLFCGPALTLPMVLFSYFRREPAGNGVIVAAGFSLLVFLFSEGGITEHSLSFLCRLTGPMLAVGIGMLALENQTNKEERLSA